MKYLFICYIFCCTWGYSQTQDTIKEDRPIIFIPGDSVYLIPKEKVEIIDMWARKGIECRKSVEESETLLRELKQDKLISDSISIMLHNVVLKTKGELTKIEEDHTTLINNYNSLSRNFELYKAENKSCKRKNVTESIGYIAMGSSLIAICLAVILTN